MPIPKLFRADFGPEGSAAGKTGSKWRGLGASGRQNVGVRAVTAKVL
jgi:hypothetical protein